MITWPRPQAIAVSRKIQPTAVPIRNGIELRKPLLCPIAIMVRLPGPGVPVIAITNSAKGNILSTIVRLLFWAVENLIKNSLDSLKEKGGKITVSARREKGKVLIRVRDEGKGIPARLRGKIFTPGFTTKRGGWGLGLTLAQRIVEEYHGGKLSLVQSSPAGTTFEISLTTEENG